MKIKCPACQAVLNIPDSAAGKVVKCPCGKQLRAPGVSSPQTGQPQPRPQQPQPGQRPQQPQPGQRPQQPQRPQQGQRPQQPQRPQGQPQRPQPQRPQQPARPQSSGGGGFDPGIFDELTDQDLQPVSAVSRPGQPQAAPASTGGKLLQQYAPTGQQGYGMSTGPMQIASVGARLAGALLDGVVMIVAVVAAFAVLIFAGVTAEAIDGGQGGAGVPIMMILALIVGGLIFLTPVVLNIVFICMYGQSIGKKLVGTRMVVEATGEMAGFVHGFLLRQMVWGLVTGIPFIGGFIALADPFFVFSENAKTLHDRLAGTVVINA